MAVIDSLAPSRYGSSLSGRQDPYAQASADEREAKRAALSGKITDPNWWTRGAYNAAAVGGNWLPGAGIADFTGQMPMPGQPGQNYPSAGANVGSAWDAAKSGDWTGAFGHLSEAGLQALDAGGELALALGPIGAVVGTLAGAPRSIRRSRDALKAVDAAMASQDFVKATRATKTHPALTPRQLDWIRRTMNPDEIMSMASGGKGQPWRIFDYIERAPELKDLVNIASAGAVKRGWYQNSHDAIMRVFTGVDNIGVHDANRFTGLVAALSPKNPVDNNLRQATAAWEAWTKAGRPQNTDEIVALVGDVMKSSGNGTLMQAYQNNVIRALTSHTDEMKFSGPKVNSFYQNLSGNLDEVTNDGWMAQFFGFLTKEGDPQFGGATRSGRDAVGVISEKSPAYLAANGMTREAADFMTELTGTKWSPAEIQETVWSWVQALDTRARSADNLLTLPEIIRQHALTDDAIKLAPDFDTLFRNDEVIHSTLEAAGYGDRLKTLNPPSWPEARAISTGIGQERSLESVAARLSRQSPGVDREILKRQRKAAEALSQTAR